MDETSAKVDLIFRWSYLWLVIAILFIFPLAPLIWLCGLRVSHHGQTYPLRLRRSKSAVIFFLLIFWPLGLILILDSLGVEIDHRIYRLEYGGRKFWSVFWIFIFFPLFLLLEERNGFRLLPEANSQQVFK